MTFQRFILQLPRFLRRHTLIRLLVRIRPSLSVQELVFNGSARALIDLNDANARTYFMRGMFEPEYFEIARQFVAPSATVFDVGANFGLCTFGLLPDFSGGGLHFHLFEANVALCSLLHRSAVLHAGHRFTVQHACVTDEKGTSRLAVTPHHLGAAYISRQEGERVTNLRLDDYCRDARISAVDFAKLDVEGSEPRVLRGAENSLRQGIFRVIYFELSGLTLRRQGFLPATSCELLRAAGYRLYFCKPDDFASHSLPVRMLAVGDRRLPVAECTDFGFGEGAQTDLLAVHPRTPYSVIDP